MSEQGVIVEYVGQNRMRFIETASERQERIIANIRKTVDTKVANIGLQQSVECKPVNNPIPWLTSEHKWCYSSNAHKTWKHQKHASRCFMRHLHRVTDCPNIKLLNETI